MSAARHEKGLVYQGAPVTTLLCDAMGTLVHLADPVRAVGEALAARGAHNSAEVIANALHAEIAFYRAQHLRGSTPAAVAELRAECAAVCAAQLTQTVRHEDLVTILVEALAVVVYPDVHAALGDLREAGVTIVVVSDWDVSLGPQLDVLGLTDLVDAVVVSADIGVTKPDQQLFHAALRAVGALPEEAMCCGDDPIRDVEGARGSGIRAVLLDREGRFPERTDTVRSLADIIELR